jgi:hypothetical protein
MVTMRIDTFFKHSALNSFTELKMAKKTFDKTVLEIIEQETGGSTDLIPLDQVENEILVAYEEYSRAKLKVFKLLVYVYRNRFTSYWTL